MMRLLSTLTGGLVILQIACKPEDLQGVLLASAKIKNFSSSVFVSFFFFSYGVISTLQSLCFYSSFVLVFLSFLLFCSSLCESYYVYYPLNFLLMSLSSTFNSECFSFLPSVFLSFCFYFVLSLSLSLFLSLSLQHCISLFQIFFLNLGLQNSFFWVKCVLFH